MDKKRGKILLGTHGDTENLNIYFTASLLYDRAAIYQEIQHSILGVKVPSVSV